MRIGIDIDDTTFITVNSMIKYADKFDVEDLGGNGINGQFGLIKNRYYLNVLYGWDDITKYNFFNKYYKDVLYECIPMENASENINKLKQEGNTIYFITARLTNISGCDAEQITIDSFNKYEIKYDKLIVNAKDKKQYCIDNKIELFIDDSVDTCEELQSFGIKALLMATRMNSDVPTNVERVHNWNEIYNYIVNMRKLGE